MTPIWQCCYWHLGLASWLVMGGALATSGDCAKAQITPDATLGAESSVVTPTNINGLPTEQIDVGRLVELTCSTVLNSFLYLLGARLTSTMP